MNKQHSKIFIAHAINHPGIYQRLFKLFTIGIRLLTSCALLGELVSKFLEGMPQRVSIAKGAQYDSLGVSENSTE